MRAVDLSWHPPGWTAVALPKALYAEWRRLTGLRDRLSGRQLEPSEASALAVLDNAIVNLTTAVTAAHAASVAMLQLRELGAG